MAMDRLRQSYERYVMRRGDGCWGWSGSKLPHGYGRVSGPRGTTLLAHRASYVLFVGEIPPGMCVCHKCDNPECSNPEHLFLGTVGENIRDCIRKGRFVHMAYRGESHGRSVLTYNDVLALREAYGKEGFSAKEWASRLGVTAQAIRLAARGVTWKSKEGVFRTPVVYPSDRKRTHWSREETGA